VALTRFYGVHIWVLPAALVALVAFHLFGVIRQGIAASPRRHPLTEKQPGESRRDAYEREYAAEKAEGKPFWEALYKDALVALAVVVIVLIAAIVLGAPLEEPANPNATNYVPRPEWYFMDLFQLLWYFGGSLEPLIIFGLFTLGALVFLAVPFLDRAARAIHASGMGDGLARVVVARPVLTMLGLTSSRPPSRSWRREGMTVNQLAGWRSTTARDAPPATRSTVSGGRTDQDSREPGRATSSLTCASRSWTPTIPRRCPRIRG
jgi:ubiquinol-cytochrome c reductase cytochrome b subunit